MHACIPCYLWVSHSRINNNNPHGLMYVSHTHTPLHSHFSLSFYQPSAHFPVTFSSFTASYLQVNPANRGGRLLSLWWWWWWRGGGAEGIMLVKVGMEPWYKVWYSSRMGGGGESGKDAEVWFVARCSCCPALNYCVCAGGRGKIDGEKLWLSCDFYKQANLQSTFLPACLGCLICGSGQLGWASYR